MHLCNYFCRMVLKLLTGAEAIENLRSKRAHGAAGEHVGGEGALHGLRVKLSDAHRCGTAGNDSQDNQKSCNKC